MKNGMNPEDVKYFITGLKSVIRRSWPTQEEFADGVTSKVNLSNILRGNSGTSQTMRKKLADKAGLSIEEVIHIGKGGSLNRSHTSSTRVPELPFNADDLINLPASDVAIKVMSYTQDLTDRLFAQAKYTTSMMMLLIDDRNRLLKEIGELKGKC